ncbi:MAG: amino acid adenylation domain-containing protein [Melioribacteraceae bacterium]
MTVNSEFLPPKTDIEKQLTEIWNEVLVLNEIGIKDNFFDLGGHSLLVTKLVVRIEKKFAINFFVKDVFTFPTILEQANQIEIRKLSRENKISLPLLTEIENKQNIPLSFSQSRLWFLDKLDENQSVYNMPMAVKVIGKLDFDVLNKTIDYLAQRHETLRTNFEEINGIPQQIIKNKHSIKLDIINLNDFDIQKQSEMVDNIKYEESIIPFNLANDSLIRFRIATISDNEFIIFFTMHHIISDGWSINILVEEFVYSYLMFINSEYPNLPELKVQYSDFSIWQHENISGKILNSQIEYWKSKLENIPSIINLPTDRKRPLNKTFNGSHISFSLNSELIRKIETQIKQLQVTPFMFLLGVFQILLSRLSGQSDICVGTPIANRTNVDVEKIIGFFANTLVMRNIVKGNSLILDYFAQVKQTVLESFENQDLPFEKLVENLNPERDLSSTPIFQVLFVLQTNPSNITENKADFRIETIPTKSYSTQFDLTLSMNTSVNNWEGTFEYNTDLFDQSTVEGFIDSFNLLLFGLVSDQHRQLYKLEFLNKTQTNRLVSLSKGELKDYKVKNVIEKFEKVVYKYSNKVACEYNDISITYDELNISSNHIKNYLIENGFKYEDIIAVLIPNSIELIKWILGIMKAGCAYLPIDPNYPSERINYILEDSKACSIVFNDELEQNKFSIKNIIAIKSDIYKNSKNNFKNFNISILKDNLSYIIYTSGSTGKPKGVMLNHKGLLNLVENQIKDFSVTDSSRILQFASIGFDASISEIFMALLSGGTLYLADREKLSDPFEIKNILVSKSISVVTLPPSLLQTLDTKELHNLKIVISAGEKLSIDVFKKWDIDRKVINAFGPTESTVGVSSFSPHQLNENWQSIPIGNPIKNVGLFILDKDLNLLQEETVGELYISGDSLARGYLNNPKLTAEKFIPNPFAKINGERIYKTGDLAKYTKDGYIEYIGRIDDQVKLRGFRIELTEIEIVIKSFENVLDAAVIVEGIGEKAKLIAFIQTKVNFVLKPEELREYLNSALPHYMIPSIIETIEKVPITKNGKVDKRKLRDLLNSVNSTNEKYEAPTSEIEIILERIWRDLLEIKKIGINDNFFELGGHSLLATQLVSRIRNTFNIDFNLKHVFENPNIKFQSKKIIDLEHIIDYQELTLKKFERPEHIPLSFAQQRLWFIDKLEPGNPFYNLPFVTKIKGELNLINLEKSIDFVIQRHEILRTLFKSQNGKPYQEIKLESNCDFKIVDFQNEVQENTNETIGEYVQNLILKPFDLENGPLLRIHILQIKLNEIVFVLSMHHIISDGWSMSILFNELISKYRELEFHEPADFPELKLQYADYSYWQRKQLSGELLKKHIEFWKEKLSGIPKLLNLPLDFPRPPLQTFNGKSLHFEIEKELMEELKIVNRKFNATSFITLLSAFQILLFRYSKQEDIVVGTPIANRNILEIEKLIGFFVNTLAIRTNIQSEKSFSEIIKDVREYSLNAYIYQDLPFEMLIDELKVERDLSHTPIFQVMFVMQNLPYHSTEKSEIKIEPIDSESGLSKFDFQFTLIENNDSIDGIVEYNTDLFKQQTIKRLIESYLLILKTVVNNLEIKIGKIPILDNSQKSKMLKLCNDEFNIKPNEFLVHQIFEENVAKYPNNTALTFENKHISYKELNERVNKLARYLIKLGVEPDNLVGLCIERSIEMVVGILAIIKSGGAYVSLDPSYPKERLNFISEDSKPKVILSTFNLKELVEEMVSTIVYLDIDLINIEKESSANPDVKIIPENIVYIIYTSGSTGKPKGVMVTHNNLIRLFSSTRELYEFNSNDVWTFFHSYAFDFSVWELWGALLYGGRVVIVPYFVSRSPLQFYELLINEKVTVLNQTPSAFRQLIQTDNSISSRNNYKLRYIIFGGDKLDLHSLKPWFDKYGDKIPKLINMYGITETTVHVTFRGLEFLDLEKMPGSVIGKPIQDLQIYILDENLEPVPIGVPGEIYVGGLGLARGYKNQPDLTAIRFIPDPFTNNNGFRLYRTGDLARFLENGDIEYLSRVDHQIQIHGFRVELGEIENIISQHPDVNETIVLAETEKNDSKKIIAYYVANENKEISVEEFKRFLKIKLPDYMLPSLFIKMEVFPLTEHGKIDRKLLPKPNFQRPTLEVSFSQPSSEIEISLAEVWKKLLNIDVVGIDDNFFNLGGDSILSIQMISFAKEKDIIITPRQVFQNPTIRELAIISKGNKFQEDYQGIITGEAELTPIQKWFFENHKKNPNRFNSSMFIEITHDINFESIITVTRKLIEQHDSLRLQFINIDNDWKQYFIDEKIDLPISIIDLSKLKGKKLENKINEEVEKIQTGFNINQAPLFRIVYFNFGEKNNPHLLFVFHHLTLDGVSWRFLINDFFTLFNQCYNGKDLDLDKKSSSYKKWVSELYNFTNNYVFDFNLNYWKKLLEFDVANKFPVDFEKGENTYGSTVDLTLSMTIQDTLKLSKEIPNVYQVSLNEILLYALVKTISAWSNSKQILVELEGHGREDVIDGVDLSRTIGWFTSIFPVVLEIKNKDLETDLKLINESINEIPNKGLDFGLLRYLSKDSNKKKIIEKIPHPKINFNFLGQFDQQVADIEFPIKISKYSAGMEQEPNEVKTSLLHLVGIINGGELHIRWLYSKNIYKSSTIKKLAKKYFSELKKIINGYDS